MKVVLLNHSDSMGGAAVVTFRLMVALRHAGVDARMLVFNKSSDSEHVTTASNNYTRGLKFLGETATCALANGWHRSSLFAISTASTGLNLSKHPWVREADVICLNWINQGMLSIRNIAEICELGKPVVWTMHDMWPMTGVCHQANSCRGYRVGCGYCPMLRGGHHAHDWSTLVAWRKSKLYRRFPITFVAVSNWLKDRALESALLADQDIRVIPNAFPTEFYLTEPLHKVRTFNIDYSKKIILMGAARLDDPIKGLDYAIDALNIIFDGHPKMANDLQAVFFGNIRNPHTFDKLRFPYRHVGTVCDPKPLRQLYASSAVILSTSLSETLPGTLIEGQAAGCVPVTFGNGGQTDIVDHLKSGYIAQYKSAPDIAKGILWAIENPIDRQFLHEEVERKFAARKVANRYVSLFNELLSKS